MGEGEGAEQRPYVGLRRSPINTGEAGEADREPEKKVARPLPPIFGRRPFIHY